MKTPKEIYKVLKVDKKDTLRNTFTSTWFSSAQSSFIPKFLVDLFNKIRRVHTVFAKSKI